MNLLTFELRPPQVCNNCFQEGHHKSGKFDIKIHDDYMLNMSTECTNDRVMKCNNCEELGHVARECKARSIFLRLLTSADVHRHPRIGPNTSADVSIHHILPCELANNF